MTVMILNRFGKFEQSNYHDVEIVLIHVMMGTLLSIIREPAQAGSYIGYVVRLARDLYSSIHLMYVEEEYEYTIGRPPAPDNYTGQKQSQRLRDAEAGLSQQVLKVVTGIHGAGPVDYSAELTSMLEVINEYVRTGRADIVVLEADVRQGFLKQITTNDDIIGEADCPVLIVPGNIEYRAFRKVVFASAFREEDLPALKDLVRILSDLSPEIKVVHVTGNPDDEKIKRTGFDEILRSQTGFRNISIEYLKDDKSMSIAGQIRKYAIDSNADLIVAMKQDSNFFEKLFSSDRTKKLLKEEPELPVMIYKVPGM